MTDAVLEVAAEVADQTVLISDMRDCLYFFVRMTEVDIGDGRIAPGNTRLRMMKRASDLLDKAALVSKRIDREG